MKIVTSEEMKRLERLAAERGLTSELLMENAGRAVALEVRRVLGGAAGRRVLVLVGPGNNGGDGLVAARHLHDWGADATAYLCRGGREGHPSLSGASSDRNLALILHMGVPTAEADADDGMARLETLLGPAEIVVDALLGTGKARPLEGVMTQVVRKIGLARRKRPEMTVVALDLPTGVNADTGATDACCVAADVTLTLGYPKTGLLTFPGASKVGELRILDIGLPPSLGEDIALELTTPRTIGSLLPDRPLDANKGTFGRVLVVAGSANYIGAAYLSCAGALRSGAGLVALAAPASLASVVASKLAEAVYLPLTEASPGVLAASVDASQLVQPFTTCLIGCGLGQSPGAARLVDDVLFSGKLAPRCWVVDADALSILTRTHRWWGKFGDNAILTPHPGEMARLTGASVPEVQSNRIGLAREAARKWGKIVVLKGAHTVVARPDGWASVSPFANPGLASPGTGDVLAGVISGLAAQGLSPYDAAVCGVYLHGTAGEAVRRELGDSGMLASDLLPALPRTIRDIKKSWASQRDRSGQER